MSGGPIASAGTLWARAPLWRLALLTAGLLTLSFFLFPPGRPDAPKLAAASAPPATYTAPPSAAPSVPAVAPTPAPSAATAATAPAPVQPKAPAAAKAAPLPAAIQPAPSTAQTRAPPPAQPGTAQLSLAPPSATSSGSQTQGGVDMMRRVYTKSIVVNGYNVPLPPGGYVMLSNIRSSDPKLTGATIFLGRIQDKRLIGAVLITAADSVPGEGFRPPLGWPEENKNLIYQTFESVTPFDHQAYWVIGNEFTPVWQRWSDRAVRITQAERAAMGALSAEGVTYAQDFVSVRFTRAEKTPILEVKCYFSPESEGVSSRPAASYKDSDWFVTNLSPDKTAYIGRLKAWSAQFWPQVKDAFAAGQAARQARGASAPSAAVR